MEKRTLFFVLIMLWASSAVAHGPSRVKVEETLIINAAPAAVWAQIKDFDNIHSWLPAVTKTSAQGGNKKGATRELTLSGGLTVKEKLKKYDEGKMSFSYKITDMSTVKTIEYAGETVAIKVLPVSNYKAWMTVEPNGKGSKVTWKAKFYRGYMNNNPPEELNEDAGKRAVSKLFKEGLANLKKIVKG